MPMPKLRDRRLTKIAYSWGDRLGVHRFRGPLDFCLWRNAEFQTEALPQGCRLLQRVIQGFRVTGAIMERRDWSLERRGQRSSPYYPALL
jgi:hypothetical protein